MQTFTFETPYDFETYFNAILLNRRVPLQKRCSVITLIEDDPAETIEEFAKKYIWYGRRDEAPICSQKRGSLRAE